MTVLLWFLFVLSFSNWKWALFVAFLAWLDVKDKE